MQSCIAIFVGFVNICLPSDHEVCYLDQTILHCDNQQSRPLVVNRLIKVMRVLLDSFFDEISVGTLQHQSNELLLAIVLTGIRLFDGLLLLTNLLLDPPFRLIVIGFLSEFLQFVSQWPVYSKQV